MVIAKTDLFDEVLQVRASLFKALAHPARLQILQFLAETKTCISGDISEELPFIPIPEQMTNIRVRLI